MTPHERNEPPNRAEHPEEPAEGDRDEIDDALDLDEETEQGASPPGGGSAGESGTEP